jgi:hypothetical protein
VNAKAAAVALPTTRLSPGAVKLLRDNAEQQKLHPQQHKKRSKNPP